MLVLSHRGYWKRADEKNKEMAFRRSLDFGFGIETDIRDCGGQLLISHDMVQGTEMTLVDLLTIFLNKKLTLALNIKADGLVSQLKKIMQTFVTIDWFVFDMSIPDMRAYLQAGLPVFTRMSEVEKEPAWLEQSVGVLLDAFSETWYNANFVDTLLQSGKRVCIVSSELHGRKFESLWRMLLAIPKHSGLMLCTDYPEKARDFFGE